jgi:hypothetical protein
MYIRPAAPARIEVSASLHHPPEALQPAHITTRPVSRSSPVPASLLSPASHQPPALREPRCQRASPLPRPPAAAAHSPESARVRDSACARVSALSRWPSGQHAPTYDAANPTRGPSITGLGDVSEKVREGPIACTNYCDVLWSMSRFE